MSELTNLFTNIANSIRAKGGTTETITANNFPEAISNIFHNYNLHYLSNNHL